MVAPECIWARRHRLIVSDSVRLTRKSIDKICLLTGKNEMKVRKPGFLVLITTIVTI